eukprot:TRINITY_DN8003_c0_g2_i1.p1 TRINITY_DN8003_c0_g2~~TRINITY_DN8003_c0_g2_i1.p1  ORF type:complete len:396 (+),score=123.37 TRINITY_DN8003_c0_g2_i1:697-1884(+)
MVQRFDSLKKWGTRVSRSAFPPGDAGRAKYLTALLQGWGKGREHRRHCIAQGLAELASPGEPAGIRSCHVVLAMLGRRKCSTGAREVLARMQGEWGLTPTNETLSHAVAACGTLEDLRETLLHARALAPGMGAKGAGHARTVALVAQLLVSEGHRGEALRLLDGAVPAAAHTPEIRATLIEAQPDYASAREEFAAQPRPLHFLQYHALLKWSAAAGDAVAAEGLVLQMELAGLRPATTALHRLLRAYANSGDKAEAGPAMLGALMGRLQRWWPGWEVTPVDYALLIRSCTIDGGVAIAETAFAKLEMTCKVVSEPAVFTALLAVYEAAAARHGGAVGAGALQRRTTALVDVMAARRVAATPLVAAAIRSACGALGLDAAALTAKLKVIERVGLAK